MTIEQVIELLTDLQRYDVGSSDDGDGSLFDFADENDAGDWIRSRDVLGLVKKLRCERAGNH